MIETIRDKGLLLSAILVGLAIPLLFFGKAWIGIMLGLAFLIALACSNHKQTIENLKSHLNGNILIPMGVLAICSVVTIPFSIRPELSIEAWFRTWLLLSAILYLIFMISDKIEFTIHTSIVCFYIFSVISSVFLLFTIIDNQLDYRGILSKYYFNSYMMLMFVIGLYYFINNNKRLFILFLTMVPFFLFVIFITKSKATIAALIIISLCSAIMFGMRFLSLKKTIFVTVIFLSAVYLFLRLFFFNEIQTSFTSNLNKDLILPYWIVDHHRQFIWIFSYELFFESPIVGFGLNATNYHPGTNLSVQEYFGSRFPDIVFTRYASVFPAHPHNWIVEIALDGGLILIIPLLFILGWTVYRSLRLFIKDQNNRILPFIFVNLVYWSIGLLNVSFWSSWWQAGFFLCLSLSFVIFIKDQNKTQ